MSTSIMLTQPDWPLATATVMPVCTGSKKGLAGLFKLSSKKINSKKSSNMKKAFSPRAMSKQELAMTYFPHSSKATAVAHLMSWIRRCAPLWERLTALPTYRRTAKWFTHDEVTLIAQYIGDP